MGGGIKLNKSNIIYSQTGYDPYRQFVKSYIRFDGPPGSTVITSVSRSSN